MSSNHCHHWIRCLNPRWPWNPSLWQSEPKKLIPQINQGITLTWTDPLASNCLASNIQGFLDFKNPRQLCWNWFIPAQGNIRVKPNMEEFGCLRNLSKKNWCKNETYWGGPIRIDWITSGIKIFHAMWIRHRSETNTSTEHRGSSLAEQQVWSWLAGAFGHI